MEGRGVTAQPSPSPEAQPEAERAGEPGTAGAAPSQASPVPADEVPEPPGPYPSGRARVDARLLEATLLNLRKRIAAIPLVFDIPGVEEVAAERTQLLSQ